ncbi:hypothetical protein [Paraburkholderia saeva]|uniref:hypothetical protein n=1 Tax=Paraburkholderia saeva TaxID=2777537 RepID=UPI001D599544|nr:hypothetical protein [Paraburkholderia saeva]CAG4887915.1 hypothetical protein R52603_00537 [Paraburkholderia saeva]
MAGRGNPSTQFSKTNQPRSRRGKDTRTKILEAIKKETKLNEQAFYQEITKRAITQGDVVLMKELMMRVAPVAKPVAPDVRFDFPEDGNPVEQVDAIMKAVSTGKVPADVGQMLVNMIRAKLDVLEISELADRLAAIEAQLAQDK